MPKFTMQSFAISEADGSLTLAKSDTITAASDNAAVDAARDSHNSIVPNVGGDFELVVTALEPGVSEMVRTDDGVYTPRPPGEISRFRVTHEPDPDVADIVYAQRAAREAAKAGAEKVEAIRAQVIAEMVAAADTPDVAKVIVTVAAQVQAERSAELTKEQETAQAADAAQVAEVAQAADAAPLISPQPMPVTKVQS